MAIPTSTATMAMGQQAIPAVMEVLERDVGVGVGSSSELNAAASEMGVTAGFDNGVRTGGVIMLLELLLIAGYG